MDYRGLLIIGLCLAGVGVAIALLALRAKRRRGRLLFTGKD